MNAVKFAFIYNGKRLCLDEYIKICSEQLKTIKIGACIKQAKYQIMRAFSAHGSRISESDNVKATCKNDEEYDFIINGGYESFYLLVSDKEITEEEEENQNIYIIYFVWFKQGMDYIALFHKIKRG